MVFFFISSIYANAMNMQCISTCMVYVLACQPGVKLQEGASRTFYAHNTGRLNEQRRLKRVGRLLEEIRHFKRNCAYLLHCVKSQTFIGARLNGFPVLH